MLGPPYGAPPLGYTLFGVGQSIVKTTKKCAGHSM